MKKKIVIGFVILAIITGFLIGYSYMITRINKMEATIEELRKTSQKDEDKFLNESESLEKAQVAEKREITRPTWDYPQLPEPQFPGYDEWKSMIESGTLPPEFDMRPSGITPQTPEPETTGSIEEGDGLWQFAPYDWPIRYNFMEDTWEFAPNDWPIRCNPVEGTWQFAPYDWPIRCSFMGK